MHRIQGVLALAIVGVLLWQIWQGNIAADATQSTNLFWRWDDEQGSITQWWTVVAALPAAVLAVFGLVKTATGKRFID